MALQLIIIYHCIQEIVQKKNPFFPKTTVAKLLTFKILIYSIPTAAVQYHMFT